MDGRGGCCIARYTGGVPYDLSKADRIMLRFRPIAPKPATDGGGGSGSSGGGKSISSGDSDASFRSGRGKRKYQQKDNSGNTRRKRSGKSVTNDATPSVTLSLLPETPLFSDLKLSQIEKSQKQQGPLWLSFSDGGGMFKPAYQKPETVTISTLMTVERVTDAWIDGYGLGKGDEERKMNLMNDTCPGFISDGLGRVTLTNEAYRKMARENIPVPEMIKNDGFHVMVKLVMREKPMLTYTTAFTCRVKLQYTCRNRERGSVTVPCDVWRMDGGGFAWRLDVKAALCL